MNFKFSNILVVAAHPDDEVLGVGGTIPLIKRSGGRVSVLIVTDGSSTQYRNNPEILKSKQEQAQSANEILGTDELIQWDFPDMRLDTVEHCKLNRAFERLIAERKYDAVFVQNSNDVNLDHQIIHRSVLVATRPFPGQSVSALLGYHVNSSTEWGGRTQATVFCPNYFVDVSSTIDTKIAAMECYVDELRPLPHPRSLEAIRQRAAVFGHEVGFHFAEAFKLLLVREGVAEQPA